MAVSRAIRCWLGVTNYTRGSPDGDSPAASTPRGDRADLWRAAAPTVLPPVGVRERIGAVTSVLPPYTTFSTFTWEKMLLVEDGAVAAAFLNVTVSAIIGVGAAACGLLIGASW